MTSEDRPKCIYRYALSRRDFELSVHDDNGAELTVVIWGTHQLNQSWREGVSYELGGGRGKRYSTQHGTRVEIHSTKAFSAHKVETDDPTRILVLGDTHVGYRHRSLENKAAWAENINAREVFVRCLQRAGNLDIDAIVHAGDVFDHENTQGDRNAVGQAISRTTEAGVPFYYIFGNHDTRVGRELLMSTSGKHLPETTAKIGEPSANIVGIDHSGQRFPQTASNTSVESSADKNVLVVHESPHPVVDDTGSLRYQNDANRADISAFVDTASFEIDLVVTGHLHVADRLRVRGCDIPVLVTGPTVSISTYTEDSNPSMWVLTVKDWKLDLERQFV